VRLDQLSTICIHDDETEVQENEAIPDANNNHIGAIDHTESKPSKTIKRLSKEVPRDLFAMKLSLRLDPKYKHAKASMALSKKARRRVWINNRQKPIDPQKYCSLCRREFSQRSNFITHVRNIHKGQLPPSPDEQDQSLLEMNEENTAQNDSDHDDHDTTESMHDQSGRDTGSHRRRLIFYFVAAIFNDDAGPLQALTKHWDVGHGRLRSRATAKPSRDSTAQLKVKCPICNKFYRSDYMTVSFFSAVY
jgi:hypothetical protein